MRNDNQISVAEAIENYLDMIMLSRSHNTARTYRNAMNAFRITLEKHGMEAEKLPSGDMNESMISEFLTDLKQYSPATEQLYTIAVTRFYQYLIAEEIANINLQRIHLIVQSRMRRSGQRLPQFPQDAIKTIVEYAMEIPGNIYQDRNDLLIANRDAALIITLADTGLRVHEACNLRRGDIDWNEYKAIIIGKGDKQAVVRFSSRAIHQLNNYLAARSEFDGKTGKPLQTLPIFSRHDLGAGKKILPISTTTARKIIKSRVREVLGEEASNTITPHSFRHYFVTNILRGSGGNLKLAQELARHKNIQVTQRYAHLTDDELDQGYFEIFDE